MSRIRMAAIAMLLGLAGYILWWVGSSLYAAGQQATQSEWDADVIIRNRAALRAHDQAREREQELQRIMAHKDKEKRDAETKLVADYAAVIASLLSRPERAGPGEGAASAGGGVGCTGAELYRQDAEFLAGEAARAERVRLQLDACQFKYDEVRKAVNGWSPTP